MCFAMPVSMSVVRCNTTKDLESVPYLGCGGSTSHLNYYQLCLACMYHALYANNAPDAHSD